MTNDKKPGNDFVHGIGFWERQCFPHEASAGLPECVVPSFHMISLPASFTNTLVSISRKNELISFPKVTVASASFVSWCDLLPKLATGCFTAIPKNEGHDLTRSAAHNCPDPAFVPLLIDKWPHFISFQNVFGIGRQKCVFKFRIGFIFFLSKKPVSVG